MVAHKHESSAVMTRVLKGGQEACTAAAAHHTRVERTVEGQKILNKSMATLECDKYTIPFLSQH